MIMLALCLRSRVSCFFARGEDDDDDDDDGASVFAVCDRDKGECTAGMGDCFGDVLRKDGADDGFTGAFVVVDDDDDDDGDVVEIVAVVVVVVATGEDGFDLDAAAAVADVVADVDVVVVFASLDTDSASSSSSSPSSAIIARTVRRPVLGDLCIVAAAVGMGDVLVEVE